MSKFSMKRGGKEVGPASVYAPPHGAGLRQPMDTETIKDSIRMSVGNVDVVAPAGVKTSGITARGLGAATKGKMARGPMA